MNVQTSLSHTPEHSLSLTTFHASKMSWTIHAILFLFSRFTGNVNFFLGCIPVTDWATEKTNRACYENKVFSTSAIHPLSLFLLPMLKTQIDWIHTEWNHYESQGLRTSSETIFNSLQSAFRSNLVNFAYWKIWLHCFVNSFQSGFCHQTKSRCEAGSFQTLLRFFPTSLVCLLAGSTCQAWSSQKRLLRLRLLSKR